MKEEGCLRAAEPSVAIAVSTAPCANVERFRIPEGLPQSVDEALADIDEREREFERDETFTHREVMQMVWDKIGS